MFTETRCSSKGAGSNPGPTSSANGLPTSFRQRDRTTRHPSSRCRQTVVKNANKRFRLVRSYYVLPANWQEQRDDEQTRTAFLLITSALLYMPRYTVLSGKGA